MQTDVTALQEDDDPLTVVEDVQTTSDGAPVDRFKQLQDSLHNAKVEITKLQEALEESEERVTKYAVENRRVCYVVMLESLRGGWRCLSC